MVDLKQEKILVTGGTGFIGGYLLLYLVQQGYTNITALRRSKSRLDLVAPIASKINWVECDLLDQPYLEDALEGVSYVFHCAAKVSFDPADRKSMFQTNVEGTAYLVNAALTHRIKKLIHVSSVAALGRGKNTKFITENTKWEWSKYNSYYGISKYQAEQEIWRGVAEGVSAVVVNPSIVIGSGFWDNGGTQRFFKLMSKGFSFYPKGNSGFVDVRDVAKYMILLMESEVQNERFILNHSNWLYKDFFATISKHLGAKAPSVEVSPLLQEMVWRLERIKSIFSQKSPFITKETARQSSRIFYYKNNKSLEYFDFGYTPLHETIRATCQQFSLSKEKGLPAMTLELL